MNVRNSSVATCSPRGDHPHRAIRIVLARRRSLRQSIGIAAVVVSSLLATGASLAPAETSSVEGRKGLTTALQGAWLPLEGGLVIGEREGTPLSAKYELDDGAFQLSVYTSNNGAPSGEGFMEVIVDYDAAIVVRAAPITDDGDLAAARAQKAAMALAKRTLADVTAGVVKSPCRVSRCQRDAPSRRRSPGGGADPGARG